MIGYILLYMLIGTMLAAFVLAEFTNSEYVFIGMILFWPFYIIKFIIWAAIKTIHATKSFIPRASVVPITLTKIVKYTGQNLLWGHHGRNKEDERII